MLSTPSYYTKDSAPGPDSIPYSAWRLLPDVTVDALLSYFYDIGNGTALLPLQVGVLDRKGQEWSYLLPFFLTYLPTILSDIFLTYLLTFFLTYLLTLFLTTYLLTCLFDIISDILCDTSFDVLSDISSDIF